MREIDFLNLRDDLTMEYVSDSLSKEKLIEFAKELVKRYLEREDEVSRLEDEISELEDEVSHLEGEVYCLEDEISELEGEISELESLSP